MSPEEREKLSEKVSNYVKSEFSHQGTVDAWHESLLDVHENWKERYKRWECFTM